MIFYEQAVADAGPDQVLDFEFTTYLNATMPDYGSGVWRMEQGGGLIQDMNDPLSKVTELSLGENEFRWTIQSAVCEDVSDYMVITVNDIESSTVITPNGDGLNDYLVFPGVDQLPGSEFMVYNRWGTEVFRNGNYQNDWDGRDRDGRELIPDTYYYILKIEPERIIKGFVEIRR